MSVDNLHNIILFGAGQIGCEVLEILGADRVSYFADNNPDIQGTQYCGKPVIDLVKARELSLIGYKVIITIMNYGPILSQFEKAGIKNYSVYDGILKKEFKHKPFRNPRSQLVNYGAFHQIGNETEFANSRKEQFADSQYDLIKAYVNSVKDNVPLFQYIEVETVNRCNGTCSFCPVNARLDKREYKLMSSDLFKSIVDQLAMLNFSGYFSPFSNNEPLIDQRLEEFLSYARKKLPDAWIYFFTNGTLFTPDRLKNIIGSVNEIIVDNYCTDGKLIEPCEMMVKEVEINPEWRGKIHIDIRNREEILLTRGGNSPNRSVMIDYGDFSCAYPFTQMIVRPDGKVSLCCNDALGEYTLGDLSKETILGVWYGEKYRKLREAIAKGRKYFGNCAKCDAMAARYYTEKAENISVSLIVMINGGSKNLRRCLDSAVFQTLENTEIIVIDNCSSDQKVKEILEDYKKLYPDKIRLVSENEIPGRRRSGNIGIRLARGKYVAFIDSNDYITFDFSEKCYNLANEDGSDLILTDFWLCSRGKSIKPISQSDYLRESESGEQAAGFPLAIVMRKEFITKSGISFSQSLCSGGKFIARMLLIISRKTSIIEKLLYYHFAERPSMTSVLHFLSCCEELFQNYDRVLADSRKKVYFDDMAQFILTDIIGQRLKEAVSFEEIKLFLFCFHELIRKHQLNACKMDKYKLRIVDFIYNTDINAEWDSIYKSYLNNIKRYYLLSCTKEELASFFQQKELETICVWGCGCDGIEISARLRDLGICCCITDMNSALHGRRLPDEGMIKPWNEIKKHVKTVIVAVNGKWRDIAALTDQDIEIFATNG